MTQETSGILSRFRPVGGLVWESQGGTPLAKRRPCTSRSCPSKFRARLIDSIVLPAPAQMKNVAIDVGRSELQQFADASFHRWYYFILGYPDRLVSHLIDELNVGSGSLIVDPFCGTGTTSIECSKRGIDSIGIDANPFATFAARTKSSFHLSPDRLERAALRAEERYYSILAAKPTFKAELAYLYLIDSGMSDRGWISPKPLRRALALRQAIQRGRDEELAAALILALTADLPSNIGNMKFGPQIYRGPPKNDIDLVSLFRERVKAMVDDLRSSPERLGYPRPTIILGDARSCGNFLQNSGPNTASGAD